MRLKVRLPRYDVYISSTPIRNFRMFVLLLAMFVTVFLGFLTAFMAFNPAPHQPVGEIIVSGLAYWVASMLALAVLWAVMGPECNLDNLTRMDEKTIGEGRRHG